MNKYKNKRYGQTLFDGTVVNWRKKKRLEKKRKRIIKGIREMRMAESEGC